jgi:hypothetical protein
MVCHSDDGDEGHPASGRELLDLEFQSFLKVRGHGASLGAYQSNTEHWYWF